MNLIIQEHLYDFSANLKRILDNELRFDNEINEISKGCPKDETIMVFMKHPFTQRYHLYDSEYSGVIYRELADPHYWKTEYLDKTTKSSSCLPFLIFVGTI